MIGFVGTQPLNPKHQYTFWAIRTQGQVSTPVWYGPNVSMGISDGPAHPCLVSGGSFPAGSLQSPTDAKPIQRGNYNLNICMCVYLWLHGWSRFRNPLMFLPIQDLMS